MQFTCCSRLPKPCHDLSLIKVMPQCEFPSSLHGGRTTELHCYIASLATLRQCVLHCSTATLQHVHITSLPHCVVTSQQCFRWHAETLLLRVATLLHCNIIASIHNSATRSQYYVTASHHVHARLHCSISELDQYIISTWHSFHDNMTPCHIATSLFLCITTLPQKQNLKRTLPNL